MCLSNGGILWRWLPILNVISNTFIDNCSLIFHGMRLRLVGIVALLLLMGPAKAVSNSQMVQDDESEDVIITVDSTNLRFSPDSVTVSEGETVRFFWSGQLLPHNAVEANGLFDSGDPERDVDYSFTFEIGMNGTYDFECEPHADFGMVGQIVVEPVQIEDLNQSNGTGDSNLTGMEDESLTFVSVIGTVWVLALAAYSRQVGGPHRGPRSGF